MIQAWIAEAARASGESVVPLSEEQVDGIVRSIRMHYTKHETNSRFLWEDLECAVSKRMINGWKIVCEYKELHPILLVQEGSSFFGYQIESPGGLYHILAESPAFEFFLTNLSNSFVLCFNHHDFLIAVGDSTVWLSDISDDNVIA